MKKSMRKMLAGLLAAAVTVSCVMPVYAAEGSPGQPPFEEPTVNHHVQGDKQNNMIPTLNTHEDGTSTMTAVESKKSKVTLPSTSIVNGVEYTNTTLAKNVLKGNKKVKELTVPASFEKVNPKALAGSNVKDLTIKGNSKKTVLGKSMLKGSKVKNLNLGTKNSKVEVAKGWLKGADPNLKMTFNFKKGSSFDFKKGTFRQIDTGKMRINVPNMSKKEFKSFKKALEDAGFEGKISRK